MVGDVSLRRVTSIARWPLAKQLANFNVIALICRAGDCVITYFMAAGFKETQGFRFYMYGTCLFT